MSHLLYEKSVFAPVVAFIRLCPYLFHVGGKALCINFMAVFSLEIIGFYFTLENNSEKDVY